MTYLKICIKKKKKNYMKGLTFYLPERINAHRYRRQLPKQICAPRRNIEELNLIVLK
jgi:hypothetical protein